MNLHIVSANFAINSSKKSIPIHIRKAIYYSLFDSHLNFGNILWGCASNKFLKKIETLQKKCIRKVSLKKFNAHSEPIFKELEILKISDKIAYCQAIFMHHINDALQTQHNDYNFHNLVMSPVLMGREGVQNEGG